MEGDFRKLEVWKQSMMLVKDIYQLLVLLPPEEKYCIGDQMRRSSVSIPSNIAEGYGRQTKKEFLQFLHIARGSLFELETQIILCKSLYPAINDTANDMLVKITRVGKMLGSFIRYQKNIPD